MLAGKEYRVSPIDSLTGYHKNPRKGNIAVIAESLKINGQYKPIVVRTENNEILAGNHTWQAAKTLGWKEIETVFISGLTDEEAERIVLVDNRSNDISSYDNKVLADILKATPDLRGTGFDQEALKDLLTTITRQEKNEEHHTGEEDRGEQDILSETGDVWELGEHKLFVGDSTEGSSYEALLGDETVDLLVTDPPYNVEYKGKGSNALTIQNDSMSTSAFTDFLTDFLKNVNTYLKPGGAFYIFYSSSMTYENFSAVRNIPGLMFKQNLAWVKNTFAMGRQDYQHRMEPCIYGWKEGASHTWTNGRAEHTLLRFEEENAKPVEKFSKAELIELVTEMTRHTDDVRFDKPSRNAIHPTMKPLDLIEYLIENSSKYGEIVLDVFGGSGSTLMAADRIKRKARIMELDPFYADAICTRFQQETGIMPRRNGQAFNFLDRTQNLPSEEE